MGHRAKHRHRFTIGLRNEKTDGKGMAEAHFNVLLGPWVVKGSRIADIPASLTK